jgi:hypothetical protein
MQTSLPMSLLMYKVKWPKQRILPNLKLVVNLSLGQRELQLKVGASRLFHSGT